MRSLSLLLALVAIASGNIFHGRVGHSGADYLVDHVQTQVNLILHVFEDNDTDLLYKLITSGGVVQDYLKTHRFQIAYVKVKNVQDISSGGFMTANVQINKTPGHGNSYCAKLDLAPSRSSPTGYVIISGRATDC